VYLSGLLVGLCSFFTIVIFIWATYAFILPLKGLNKSFRKAIKHDFGATKSLSDVMLEERRIRKERLNELSGSDDSIDESIIEFD
jgi:hypothetical protein